MSLTAEVYINSDGAILVVDINSEVMVFGGEMSGEDSFKMNSVDSLVFGVLAITVVEK